MLAPALVMYMYQNFPVQAIPIFSMLHAENGEGLVDLVMSYGPLPRDITYT